MIPYDVSDILPVVKDNSMCVSCHIPEYAEIVMATAILKTHLIDMRRNRDLNGQFDEACLTVLHVTHHK